MIKAVNQSIPNLLLFMTDSYRKGKKYQMDPDTSPVLYWIAPLVFALIAAVINAGYTSVVTLSDAKVKRLAEEGDKKARKIVRLTEDPVRFLFCIDVATTICTIAAAGFSSVWMQYTIDALPISWNSIAVGFTVAAAALLWIILFFVFAILIPRRLASQFSERMAGFLITPLSLLCLLSVPVSVLSRWTASLLLSIFRIDYSHDVEKVTEEEIMMMVDAGNEKGVIDESEKQMIFNIFDFDDKTAGDVMTHRTDIVGIEVSEPMSEVISLVIAEGYSRIPVFEDNLDNIIGTIYVKDLLPLIGRGDVDSMKTTETMRPTLYIPESVPCRELFTMMRDQKIQMAVVVDEYGGTAGIVTLEDLIESIVGNIQDEYDEEEEEFQKIDDDTYLIDGTASLDDFYRVLAMGESEDTEYDTVGGLIMDLLGRIPDKGETPSVEYTGWKLTVLEALERRIVKVRAERIKEEE